MKRIWQRKRFEVGFVVTLWAKMNKQIQNVADQINNKFNPDKIILFGSQASGNYGADSDVDLLVVMEYSGSARYQAVKILTNIDYHIPLDLIIRSNKQILKRIEMGDFFLKDIIENGIVVHEKNLS